MSAVCALSKKGQPSLFLKFTACCSHKAEQIKEHSRLCVSAQMPIFGLCCWRDYIVLLERDESGMYR
eukprot:5993812-Amphidinium_carterae.1